ncbi:MAG: hypothetical protein AB7C98_07690 [Acidithiobacillus sp.]
MKIVRVISKALLLLGLAAPASTLADDLKYWSFKDFSKPLGGACHERWKFNGGGDTGPKPPLVCDPADSQIPAKTAKEGAWKLTLTTLCSIESSWYAVGSTRPMMSYKSPAVVENYGDHMTYTFVSQAVTEEEVPEVEKQIQDLRDKVTKEYKDTQVNIVRANGAYMLVAKTDFSKGLSRDDIKDRLFWVTGESLSLLCDITNGQELYRMGMWDRLKGADLTYLNKAEFYTLNQTLHEGYKEVEGDGKEGNWGVSFGGGSYKVWMENFGDKMILWVAVPHKATDSEDVQQKATAAVEKWVSKNKFEDAAEMRVLWNDEWVWIGADYPYKGLTGKKVMNLAQDFEKEYAPETADDLKDELEDFDL